jgi:hypothetical protein
LVKLIVNNLRILNTFISNPIYQFLILATCRYSSNYGNVNAVCVFIILFIFFNISYSTNYRSLYTVLKIFVGISGNTLFPIVGYSSYMFVLFVTICLFNLFGLVPYSLTLTSLALTTLFFGMQSFCGLNILAFTLQNSKLVSLFLPSGSPLAMS